MDVKEVLLLPGGRVTDAIGTTAPLGAPAAAAAEIGMVTPYAVKSPTRTHRSLERLINVAKDH